MKPSKYTAQMYATLTVKPGYIEKREFEYKRHGTQALLAGMDVGTGKVIPLVRDTQTEQDFVIDRLNIHMSEAAVKAVARN
ncbi:hypothetical protein [Parendozoicomonas sp. Alg238-R29]|uniref:hypothetical protein n=1 Tax=Parendozoicomonas sp. Alg238-R29 TaxID=2993446 RepID=UPI00248DD99B|nr:hypothetical protein [Parendozoicomonas sp. Alg238-R29]